ncbi:uncharacterized protein LOC113296351 [Papaver somniferum]|uniref:uncharacterized protein LOC113296351 n=1 Tax=Papaver somniferum TaxID=3469 RepID=UPI000E703679|nr:uncharacterized protein LOC113296351 [Papaver somniferum]
MRVLFWNINGVARESTQCKIRDLIRDFKPEIFCLAEPKVACSSSFRRRLHMEVNMSKQAITIEVEGVHISFVHASYVQTTRRSLWHQLNLQDTSTPWMVMGDFNCILRLNDKKGGLEPRTSAIDEFSDWMDDNNLFEADSMGIKFTWTNRQSGSDRILSKLDRAIINYAWLAKFENWRCKALPREISDHSTLLGYPFVVSHPKRAPFHIQKMWFLHTNFLRMVQDCWNMPVHCDPDFIFPYKLKRLKGVMQERNLLYYEAKFNGQELDYDMDLFDYSHDSITSEESLAMDNIPTHEEIKQAVFDLGADSAPGPDGFSGCFYRHCWDIIQDDLVKAVIHCWGTGHIPNGVNSSFIILLDKVRGANNLRNFRPIGLSNFFFKIFTKILATRLGSVLDKLVSEEQVAFMKGRNIHENISLASEMVNELHIKRKDGNIGLKLNISQAFDTVSWSFVLEVFRRYGFSEQWCSWIFNILNSARISILLNGNPEGYFKINRGLRQGDPLSPLLFVLIEDVLSRNITKLFSEKKMNHMVTRGSFSPTHLFFADDIMIFCKGNLKSLQNLVDLLGKYQRASGQTVCRQKSKIYYGGGSLSRRTYLADYLGMSVATFSDRYLGVQIMPGSVKYHHIANVVEKIKAQLAGWKGRHLSFNDRIVMVKSVISSYSIHNMAIYRWPRKFIIQCERAIRNFIWSGNSNVSRAVVVAFDKICCPFEERGLCLTRMATMNTTLLMKLWWNIRTSNKKWDGFRRAKFLGRNGHIKQYSVKSSILPSIQKVHYLVDANTKVQLGYGRSTSLYYDAWHGNRSVADILNDFSLDRTILVSDMLIDNQWMIPEVHLNILLAANLDVNQLPNPVGGSDTRIWMSEYKGDFTDSSAKELIRQRYGMLEGASLIWRKEIHPTLTAQNWKFLRKACATYDLIRDRFKIQLANKCSLCGVTEKTLDHVLFQCSFVARDWNWISSVFGIPANVNLMVSYKDSRSRSRMIRDLWLLANMVIRSELWAVKNKAVFEQKQANWSVFFKRVLNLIQDYLIRLKGHVRNYPDDVILLNYFRVKHRSVKFVQPMECYWQPPDCYELQLCCDGAARGSPGIAGAGVVSRHARCNVIGAMSIGLGITTNYLAELYGILVGLEWATRWGFRRICIRSYSASVVAAFTSNSLPWFARPRWLTINQFYEAIRFIHTFREANFSADIMEKRGCFLDNEVGVHFDGRPQFLISVEKPHVAYYRFK